MKSWILILLTLLSYDRTSSQTIISGYVKNRQHEPIIGASITLLNTYSGATSSQDGSFSFSVSESGSQKIQVTIMGYKNYETDLIITDKPIVLEVILQEMISELQAVTVSAGTFEASDKKRNTILKPIDIVTMAGKQADIVAALSTLPGAQQVGDSEGLFIRGGTGQETKVFIDGMMVTNPFFSSVPDVAQRSRFSPLLFKGTNFSSGGYSAQFGQGLSSALTLETHDLPTRTETNIIASSPQLTVTRYQLNKKKTASAGMTVNYNNLKPYFTVVPQTLHYTKAPEIINGELFGRVKTKIGMLKYYGYANYNLVAFDRKSIEGKDLVDYFKLKNKHVFTILTYHARLKNGWSSQSGIG